MTREYTDEEKRAAASSWMRRALAAEACVAELRSAAERAYWHMSMTSRPADLPVIDALELALEKAPSLPISEPNSPESPDSSNSSELPKGSP